MDLRSEHSYWPLRDGLGGPYPPLRRDESCAVAVVGAGITGALIAHRLAADGLDCVVLDRRDAGCGSTAASTSILQYEIDTGLVPLGRMIGEDDAALAYRLCHEGVLELERIVGTLPEDCGLARRPSLYLASDDADVPALERELEARRRIGIDVELLRRWQIETTASFTAPAALLSHTAAVVDAYRLTHALLDAAARRGARVYDRTRVASITPCARGGCTLRTTRGPEVRAGHVVVAAGYEAQELLARPVADLRSTFALVTEPLDNFDGWPRRAVIWETARPYFYLRTTDDGRAMVGGLDEPFDDPARRDALVRPKSDRLLARFRDMFPRIGGAETAYAWAGTFGQTADGLAYLGQTPELPGPIFALGYGGNGMTFSVVMASMIAELLEGRQPEGAHLFRFGRTRPGEDGRNGRDPAR